jgi:hypothetical protein
MALGIGEIGQPVQIVGGDGIVASASFLAVAEAYGAGDIQATPQEFVWRYAGSGLTIPAGRAIRVLTARLKIGVGSVPSGMTSFSMPVYLSQPASTGQGNNDAWAAKTADLSIFKGQISLGTPVDLGDFLFVRTASVNFDIVMTSSSLWGTLVTAGAHTASAVARTVELDGLLL